MHFHAIARADGADGQGSAPPAWLSGDLLGLAVRHAVRAVSVPFPTKLGHRTAPRARWGEMLDISVISDREGSQRAARYTTKYLVKGTDSAGVLDRRVRGGEIELLHEKGLSTHQCRLVETAWKLGGRPELEHLRLRAWLHQLGYRGNCIGRSRGYSTTLGKLRRARIAHVSAGSPHSPGGQAPVIRLAEWRWCGTGYLTKGDALLAQQWAERAVEWRYEAWFAHNEYLWEMDRLGWPDVDECVTVDTDVPLKDDEA